MSDEDYRTTRLESVEDIRRATRREKRPGDLEAATPPSGSLALPLEQNEVARFRPCNRPPMALLCVVDDGRDDGQWCRIHGDRFVVGRTTGDLTLPHEGGMSGSHFEITRSVEDGRFRWRIKDLDSTNGTFVRISDAVLRHGQELLVGHHLFRFDAGAESPAARAAQEQAGPTSYNTTQQWRVAPPAQQVVEAALVQPLPDGSETRHPVLDTGSWVGSDPSRCQVAIGDDPFITSLHARVFRDDQGRWHVENCRSLNGTWVRVKEAAVDQNGEFRAGEQRFLFRIP